MTWSVNGVIITRGPFTLEAHRWPFCGNGVDHEITPFTLEAHRWPFCGNGIGDMEGGDWWATLPVEAGPAATAAPAAGSNIPEGLSSPAALAQRQKCPVTTGHDKGAPDGASK